MCHTESGRRRLDRALVLVTVVVVGQTFERLVFPKAVGGVTAEGIATTKSQSHLFADVLANVPKKTWKFKNRMMGIIVPMKI